MTKSADNKLIEFVDVNKQQLFSITLHLELFCTIIVYRCQPDWCLSACQNIALHSFMSLRHEYSYARRFIAIYKIFGQHIQKYMISNRAYLEMHDIG